MLFCFMLSVLVKPAPNLVFFFGRCEGLLSVSIGLKLILVWSEMTQYVYIYIDTCDWNIISFALQIELNSCVLFSLHLRVAVRTRSPSMFLSTRKQWNSLPLQCQLPSR